MLYFGLRCLHDLLGHAIRLLCGGLDLVCLVERGLILLAVLGCPLETLREDRGGLGLLLVVVLELGDGLVREARIQARKAGMTRSDVTRAKTKVRKRR